MLSSAFAQPEDQKDNVDQSAQILFQGKLIKVQQGPVAQSMPPIYNHTLTFRVEEVFRGDLEAGDEVTLHHSARQKERPQFPTDNSCVVAANQKRGHMVALQVKEATMEQLASVDDAVSLPLGWIKEKDQLISPWAGRPGVWPATDGQKCAQSGRPALSCGPDIRFEVKPVEPQKKIKWTNPDGDGLYELTVTNTSKEIKLVPALLSQTDRDGKQNILWNESVCILCQAKIYPVPLSKGAGEEAKPVSLKSGESVSARLNVMHLNGPEWPRGGRRVEFQFCLGELSQTASFYYMSRHHDKIRESAQKELVQLDNKKAKKGK